MKTAYVTGVEFVQAADGVFWYSGAVVEDGVVTTFGPGHNEEDKIVLDQSDQENDIEKKIREAAALRFSIPKHDVRFLAF